MLENYLQQTTLADDSFVGALISLLFGSNVVQNMKLMINSFVIHMSITYINIYIFKASLQ